MNDNLLYQWSGTQSYLAPEVLTADTNGYDGIKNVFFHLKLFCFYLQLAICLLEESSSENDML